MALLTEARRYALNKMNSTALACRLGDQINIQKYASDASAGGSASEAMVVSGLSATDTVLAITQKTKGGNSTAIVQYATLIDNGVTITWTANPGANAIVEVLVLKAAPASFI